MTAAIAYTPDFERDADERLESLANRASKLAHDLNNVFTPITGYALLVRDDLASAGPAAPDIAQMLLDLDIVIASTRRGVELVKELLALATAEGLQRSMRA